MRVTISSSFNCLLHCAQTWFIMRKSPGFKILEVEGDQCGCDQKSPIFPCTLCCRENKCRPHCRQSHRSCPARVFLDTVSKEVSLCSLSYWWRRWVFNPPPQHQECRTLQIAEFASLASFLFRKDSHGGELSKLLSSPPWLSFLNKNDAREEGHTSTLIISVS